MKRLLVLALLSLLAARTVEARPSDRTIRAALAHQNEILARHGLERLSTEPASWTRRARELLVPTATGASFQYFETLGRFSLSSGDLRRDEPNDLFGLNHVYEGRGRLRSTPLALAILRDLPVGGVRLFRSLSADEQQSWLAGRFDRLGADWGHVLVEDGGTRPTKVLHFSTDAVRTSAAGAPQLPRIEISVPRRALLRLARRGSLFAGTTDEGVSELVFPVEEIASLARSGRLGVRALGPP